MRDPRLARNALWLMLLLCSVAGAAERGALLAAAKHGTAAEVSDLLADEADPDEADADGTTALHWAAHNGDLPSASALLAAGAAPDVANRYGVRPTYLAAENGDASMMRALLAAGADSHATFAEGETLLMTASRTGDVATIEALIAAGVDVDAVEARGRQTALMSAAAENNGPAVAALIAAGAERDARDGTGEFTALAFAVRGGAVDSTKALLVAGADANASLADGTSMLVLAAINANYEVMSLLLDHGADANAAAPNGWTSLHYIARVRRWNRGFNLPGPEHRDQRPSLAVARKLVAHGADVNARITAEDDAGVTAFLFATKFLDLAYMRTLLELGADPKITMADGTTAVMAAAGVGQGFNSAGNAPGSIEEAMAAVELTLEIGGGTVNDVNKSNETPLHGAMYRGGSLPLIDLLVEHGANLELVANSRGWTPLRIADGVALDGSAFIRYPDAAAHLRELIRTRGLPVPPVEWDGPAGQSTASE
jgi:uncharacterized protein